MVLIKKIYETFFSFLTFLFCATIIYAQNVGVGTSTPAEKLDVNGNVNFSGQLKTNGNGGNQGQVLMKDAGNNPVWGDISEFKNSFVFDCYDINPVNGNHFWSTTWTVPANVTEVFIEAWGGGGGGSKSIGGGGGGYISGKINVAPFSILNLSAGGGGNKYIGGPNAANGAQSSVFYDSANMIAYGGIGASSGDPFAPGIQTQPNGGNFFSSYLPGIYKGIGFNGSPGGYSKISYQQVSTGVFVIVMNFGDGGDAAMLPNSGAKGGYELFYGSTVFKSLASKAVQQGGGGGADDTNGTAGGGGRIIIRW